MEEVKKWLAGKSKDYSAGLTLLIKNSKNRILINRLSRREWPEKLEYELRKMLDHSQERKALGKKLKEEAKKVKAAQAEILSKTEDEFSIPDPEKRKIIVREQELKLDELPKDLQEKWKENTMLYKESRSLHEKLKLLQGADDNTRKPVAERLIEISKKVRENWALIDAFDPNEVAEVKTTAAVDHKRINSNRTYISRNKQNKAKAAEVQQRIDEVLASGEVFSDEITQELKKLGFSMEIK